MHGEEVAIVGEGIAVTRSYRGGGGSSSLELMGKGKSSLGLVGEGVAKAHGGGKAIVGYRGGGGHCC